MNCKDIKNKLIFFIDENIEENKKTAIDKHLADCKDCKDAFSILNLSLRNIETEKQISGNPFISTQILAKIEGKTQKKSAFRLVLQPIIASLIIFFGIWIGQNISDNYLNAPDNLQTQNTQEIDQSVQYAMNDYSYEEYYFVAAQ
jgi:hypothetical protein